LRPSHLPCHATLPLQELCQKIMAGSYNAPDWLSPAAKDLLARMLTVDPERRISLAEVAAHPWTRGSGPAWEMPAVNCYCAPAVVTGPSGAGKAAAAREREREELTSGVFSCKGCHCSLERAACVWLS
jgi:serine/threonine protein kinase